MKNNNDIKNFLLTKDITVGQVTSWIEEKTEDSKIRLIDFVYHVLYNRYLKHLSNIDSGFLKMAISCLMIETLESFRQGKDNTNNKSKSIFKNFFLKEAKANLFLGFEDISDDFYINIRCGILHQADTTNGWRILLHGNLLDNINKTINANLFVESLENSLNNYKKELEIGSFGSEIWNKLITKLEAICKNCESTV